MLTTFLVLWMSAQAVQIPTCQGCWQIWIATPSPLEDVVLSEIPDENAWGNEANGSCNMGKPVLANPVENLGNGDIVPNNNQLLQEFAQAAQRAADETDGKPKSEFLGTPAIPSVNNVSCYKDSRTHHMLCLNAQGQSLDVEQLLIEELGKLMNGIPAAEPMDVPAVQEPRTYKTGTSTIKSAPECKGRGMECNIAIITEDTATQEVTTCADKARILLRSENGTAHCIKFPEAK